MAHNRKPDDHDAELTSLLRAISAGDAARATRMLESAPQLALASIRDGATRQTSAPFFLEEIGRQVYSGDTALHIAAAAYQLDVAKNLLAKGAALRARNRRGAEPLHSACVGQPGSKQWNPNAQAAIVEYLIRAGADPNATDKSGVTPLHRAVRTRCAAAVNALLANGADAHRTNGSGSTPLDLAVKNTGRSGSGTAAAHEQQAEIVGMLTRRM